MAVLCVAVEHGELIEKKEGSWVKLKAFPTNVARPNNSAEDCSISLKFHTDIDHVTLSRSTDQRSKSQHDIG